MSLSEERVMILKMLQEGRINTDEAAKLLEALDSSQKQASGNGGRSEQSAAGNANEAREQRQRARQNYYDEIARFRERINDWRKDFSKNYNQKDFDKMVDDFSTKAEKVGKEVASATFGVVDKVVDFVGSFVDTGTFNVFGSYSPVEKTYEADAAEGMNLDLKATNGPITVKKHSENKILIKARIRTPRVNTDDVLVFTNDSGTVSLKPANNDSYNLSVSYEIFVPAVKFNKLTLETKNSKIYVEDTLSEEFKSITRNAAIDLTGVNSTKIAVETKNAKVVTNYLIGKDIDINTKNSMIDIKNIKAERLGVYTTNGKVLLETLQAYNDANEVNLILRTRNADIKVNLNDPESNGYKVSARTGNGGINLLIPGLLYRNLHNIYESCRQAEAETENYGSAARKVNINAETQNGYIEVIK